MFPNVPPAILRAEYIRAGSVPGAIERLLVVSANYPARPQENARVNSPLANPPKVETVLRASLFTIPPRMLEFSRRHSQRY